MIQLRGPLGEHLDGAPSDARVARVEQAVAERRRRDTARGSWRLVLVPAAAAAIAAALVTAWALRAPESVHGPALADVPATERAPKPDRAAKDEALARDTAGPDDQAPVRDANEVARPSLGATGGIEGARVASDERKGTRADDAGLDVRAPRRVDGPGSGGLARVEPKALRARDARLGASASKVDVPAEEEIERALTEADAARARGANDEAIAILVAIADRHASDDRAAVAAFTAARIQQDVLGDARGALRSLETALRLGLADELREPARARRIDAWLTLGDERAARTAALDYLAHHPEGASAERARRLERVGAR